MADPPIVSVSLNDSWLVWISKLAEHINDGTCVYKRLPWLPFKGHGIPLAPLAPEEICSFEESCSQTFPHRICLLCFHTWEHPSVIYEANNAPSEIWNRFFFSPEPKWGPFMTGYRVHIIHPYWDFGLDVLVPLWLHVPVFTLLWCYVPCGIF